ncbi:MULTISPECIES: YtxH domain-containing protein [unclassified Lysinibacillus]|uniref:YtxH domain-containing protein n=1 Tax=unclassified Lysinibacillus TaxID=2636778 RepID=UPI00116CEABB|nr:YtxH domain-containing protein [Lysinibacillus sp. CD3-6]QPQ34658.1 YtxH domain-containing protein [Lysinibacillus sp. JNUCC-52]UED79367.1 YtxH domain-containing protein [Lysinibacillus sp. CD3-6]
MTTQKPNFNEVKEQQLESTLPQLYNSQDSIYEEERVNMKDFVIGALVGGIVGAAAGLLLAPKSGKDLRSDVAVQAVNLKDKSADLSSTAKDKTVQLSKQIQEQSSQLVEKVKTLKTAKAPTVFDDGTVSFEGEEPLEDFIDDAKSEQEEVSEKKEKTDEEKAQEVRA